MCLQFRIVVTFLVIQVATAQKFVAAFLLALSATYLDGQALEGVPLVPDIVVEPGEETSVAAVRAAIGALVARRAAGNASPQPSRRR